MRALRHHRDRHGVLDLADLRRICRARDAAVAPDVGRHALERHDGARTRLLGDPRLLGVGDVHDDPALQHLGEAGLDPHRAVLGHGRSLATPRFGRARPHLAHALWKEATEFVDFAEIWLWKVSAPAAIACAMCHRYTPTARLLSPQADTPGPEVAPEKRRGPAHPGPLSCSQADRSACPDDVARAYPYYARTLPHLSTRCPHDVVTIVLEQGGAQDDCGRGTVGKAKSLPVPAVMVSGGPPPCCPARLGPCKPKPSSPAGIESTRLPRRARRALTSVAASERGHALEVDAVHERVRVSVDELPLRLGGAAEDQGHAQATGPDPAGHRPRRAGARSPRAPRGLPDAYVSTTSRRASPCSGRRRAMAISTASSESSNPLVGSPPNGDIRV